MLGSSTGAYKVTCRMRGGWEEVRTIDLVENSEPEAEIQFTIVRGRSIRFRLVTDERKRSDLSLPVGRLSIQASEEGGKALLVSDTWNPSKEPTSDPYWIPLSCTSVAIRGETAATSPSRPISIALPSSDGATLDIGIPEDLGGRIELSCARAGTVLEIPGLQIILTGSRLEDRPYAEFVVLVLTTDSSGRATRIIPPGEYRAAVRGRLGGPRWHQIRVSAAATVRATLDFE